MSLETRTRPKKKNYATMYNQRALSVLSPKITQMPYPTREEKERREREKEGKITRGARRTVFDVSTFQSACFVFVTLNRSRNRDGAVDRPARLLVVVSSVALHPSMCSKQNKARLFCSGEQPRRFYEDSGSTRSQRIESSTNKQGATRTAKQTFRPDRLVLSHRPVSLVSRPCAWFTLNRRLRPRSSFLFLTQPQSSPVKCDQ